jgi:hypothetical protein
MTKSAFALPINILALAVLIMLVSSPSYADIITDNFDDNLLDTSLWEPIIIGNGAVDEINNRLEAKVESTTDPWTMTIAGVAIRGTITGNFEVIVDYELLLPLALTDDEPFVGIAFDETFSLNPVMVARGVGVENDIPYDAYGSVIDNEVHTPPPAISDMSGSLRFTRVGSSMSAYYWGTSGWQLIDTASGFTDPFSFLAIGVGIEGPETVFAAFDNFSLEADQFTPIPEHSTFFLLGTVLVVLGLVAYRHKRK